MARRWTTEKIFGDVEPHSGQLAGSPDRSKLRSFVKGPHSSQLYS
jgi:hypothetical protein